MQAVEELELSTYAKILNDVIGVWSVFADPHVGPLAGSPAIEELRAALEEPAAVGVWGEVPVRMAYAVAIMCYSAALEQARAMLPLMAGDFSAVPVVVLARSLLEAASQAWWLLEPEIGHRRRVKRLQALRFRSGVEGERAAEADGAAPDQYHRYTETTDQVMRFSQALGLAIPSQDRNVYVCGGERLPTASRRVVMMFADVDVPSLYHLYSGFPHGELFALRQGFEQVGDRGLHWRPTLNVDTFKGVVAVTSYAFYPPGARIATLFGLDVPKSRFLN